MPNKCRPPWLCDKEIVLDRLNSQNRIVLTFFTYLKTWKHLFKNNYYCTQIETFLQLGSNLDPRRFFLQIGRAEKFAAQSVCEGKKPWERG